MLNSLMSVYEQYYSQFVQWYHASDILTQYVVIVAFGIVLFLLSIIMIFSRLVR